MHIKILREANILSTSFWKKHILYIMKMLTPLASDTPPSHRLDWQAGAHIFSEFSFTWFYRHRLPFRFCVLVRVLLVCVIFMQGRVFSSFSNWFGSSLGWPCSWALQLCSLYDWGAPWRWLQPRGWRWWRRWGLPLLVKQCRLMWLSLNWVEGDKMVNFIPPLFILHTLLFSY